MNDDLETDAGADERPHILIVEARYYEEIGEMLLAGCEQVLNEADVTYDRVNVPGALEIPAAIRIAIEAGQHDAYVALGCVIEGETWHDRIVGGESARGLMDLALYDGALIGNGILTVHNEAQAKKRADPKGKCKGGDAARAALALLDVRARLSS
ncbi:MAG: 6,7-dimethyl-8-ribityllumazine synthase [Alphaproteobacteria bacterium]